MSYVSFLKTIPDFLSQPAGIAALASLGIHGVIAFLLPLMPVETKKTEEAKTLKPVGLVKLNEAERLRIPQTNPTELNPNTQQNLQASAITLPEFATKPTPLPGLAPPPLAPPPISSTRVMPPLPMSGRELGIDALPKVGKPRNPKSNPFRVGPNDRFGARQAQSASANTQRFVFKDPTSDLNSAPNQISRPKIETQTNIGNNRQTGILQSSSTLPKLQAGALPSELPKTPVPVAGDATSVSALPTVINNAGNATPIPRAVSPIADSSQKVNGKLTSAKGVQIPQSKVKAPLSKKKITEPELIARVKQNTPNVQIQAVPLQPSLDLPKGAKATNVKGGLVVDSEGRIGSFELLDKSVSSNLKVAVREHFKNYFQKNPVKASGKPKYFSFNVVFEPTNAQISSSGSRSLRKRLSEIRENRNLKPNTSPSSPAPSSEATTIDKSSSIPISIQSVIRTDRSTDGPGSNQKSQPGVLSQRLTSIPSNSKDNSGNRTQISSSERQDQKNLILRLRELREQRKTKTSDFQ